MIYLWLLTVLVFAVAEVLTVKWIALSFLPGSIGAMVLAFFKVHIAVQIAVFLATSLVAFAFFKIFLIPLLCTRKVKWSIESAIGEKCVVAERIDNLAGRGAVMLNGFEWAARTVSDEITVEEGERVEIIAVEGVRLICQKRS